MKTEQKIATSAINVRNNLSIPVRVVVSPNRSWAIGDVIGVAVIEAVKLAVGAWAEGKGGGKGAVPPTTPKPPKPPSDASKMGDVALNLRILSPAEGVEDLADFGLGFVPGGSIVSAIWAVFKKSTVIVGAGEVVTVFEKDNLAGLRSLDPFYYLKPSVIGGLAGAKEIYLTIIDDNGQRSVGFNSNSDHSWIVTEDAVVRAKHGTTDVEAPDKGKYDFGAYVRVVAQNSQKALTLADWTKNSGSRFAEQREWGRTDDQSWKIQPTGDGYFRIVSRKSGTVLDVEGAADGSRVKESTWKGKDSQKWKLNTIGLGYVEIESKHASGKVLSVKDGSTTDGGQIQINKRTGGAAQRWKSQLIDWNLGEQKTDDTPFVSNGYVYFRGNDNNKLWAMKTDGRNRVQTGGFETKSQPVVFDGNVYFRGADDKLWKVSLDGATSNNLGSHKTNARPCIATVSAGTWFIPRRSNLVAFQGTNDMFYLTTTDGATTLKTEINAKSAPSCSGNRIAFRGKDNALTVVTLSLDGTTLKWSGKTIAGHTTIDTPYLEGRTIYYLGENKKIYRVQEDGSDSKMFASGPASSGPVGRNGLLHATGGKKLLGWKYGDGSSVPVGDYAPKSVPFQYLDYLFVRGDSDKLWRTVTLPTDAADNEAKEMATAAGQCSTFTYSGAEAKSGVAIDPKATLRGLKQDACCVACMSDANCKSFAFAPVSPETPIGECKVHSSKTNAVLHTEPTAITAAACEQVAREKIDHSILRYLDWTEKPWSACWLYKSDSGIKFGVANRVYGAR